MAMGREVQGFIVCTSVSSVARVSECEQVCKSMHECEQVCKGVHAWLQGLGHCWGVLVPSRATSHTQDPPWASTPRRRGR